MSNEARKRSKRTVVGSIVKPKEGTTGGDYLKLRGDVKDVLIEALKHADSKKGISLRLESAKQQSESLASALANGKLSEEIADKVSKRIEAIPNYVRFEVVLVSSKD